MGNGMRRDRLALPYEDWISIKKWMKNENYTNRRTIQAKYTQTGTAGAVEVENPSGETIAQIGKTGITLMASITNGDDADYNTKVVIGYYIANDGTKKTMKVTLTATMHTTAVAWKDYATGLVPVTDFYCWNLEDYDAAEVLVSNIAIKAGDTFIAHTTGDETIIWGTISATATYPTEAQLYGVGSIGIQQKTDQVGTDGGAEVYGKYRTPWGAKKYYLGILDPTATNTYVDIFTATYDETTNTYTATVHHCMDFYRRIETNSELAAADEILIVDRTGAAAVYDVIAPSDSRSIFTRYMAPYSDNNEHAFLGSILVKVSTAAITLALTYTPKDAVTSITESIPIPVGTEFQQIDIGEELEPMSEVSMTILGNTAVVNLNAIYLEGTKA